MKVRRKPVTVEAEQFLPMAGIWPKGLKNLMDERPGGRDVPCSNCQYLKGLHGFVRGPNGLTVVCPGDWIIRGSEDEIHPCKDDVFKATYDTVSE